MSLVNIDQVVTHYTLSTHPRNKSIIDLTNKRTGELGYIKIRQNVADMYAISLVDPKTFVAYAATHCKSATTRSRSIVLHCGDEKKKDDIEVTFKETARLGFEWCFEWANEKYRWIRESPISGSLECRRKAGGGDVCVAQYLPRGIKNEYFGLFSLLGYNMTGLDDRQRRGLELMLCISLLTMLDKSDESGWINNRRHVETIEEIPAKKKEEQRRKIDREVQQRMEREMRRSQKQMVQDDQQKKSSSKNNSPHVSPIPTPTTSTKTLTRQRSASQLRERLANNLANMKHIDATATLQLPAAAAANSTPLESMFSPPQTSPPTTPSAYYATNPLPYYCYYAASTKSSNSSNVPQPSTQTSRWEHQQQTSAPKRPISRRRVSTGDQVLQSYGVRMYPQLTQQQQHHIQQQQQRYVAEYYSNYMYQ